MSSWVVRPPVLPARGVVAPSFRRALPPHLAGRPFLVSEARAAGVSEDVLRHPDLRRPFHGVRVPGGLPDDLETTCRAALLLLPAGTVLTGTTGAALRGLPLPAGVRSGLPVRVALPSADLRVRVRGVDARASPAAVPGRHRGLPVEPGHRVWIDLAPRLSLADAVALADGVLRRAADPDRLHREVAGLGSSRHVRFLREVAALARCRVDSPQETRVRLLVTGIGLPEPELGADVHDAGGGWIARPDLQWRSVRVAVEYEGDHHRTDRRQWQSDVGRDELLQREGYRVVRLTAASVLRDPARMLDHLWCELAQRGLQGLPPRPPPAAVRALVARLDAPPGRAAVVGAAPNRHEPGSQTKCEPGS